MMRKASASQAWVAEQLTSGFFCMVTSIHQRLNDWDSLAFQGFAAVTARMQEVLGTGAQAVLDRFKGDLIQQEELATQLGSLCMDLTKEVTTSWLWMLIGWPQRAV
eukprot:5452975-Lingulodinium_polyedra.AAC.1